MVFHLGRGKRNTWISLKSSKLVDMRKYCHLKQRGSHWRKLSKLKRLPRKLRSKRSSKKQKLLAKRPKKLPELHTNPRITALTRRLSG